MQAPFWRIEQVALLDVPVLHPYSRGGWSRHYADLTYAWVEDVLPMAKVTSEMMIEYLKSNPWASRGHPPAAWPDVEKSLLALAVNQTKTEKAQWFQVHGIKNGALRTAQVGPPASRPRAASCASACAYALQRLCSV